LERYDEAVFAAAWAHQRNIGELDVLKAVLAAAGLDAAACSDAIQTDEVKKGLIDLSNRAIERGAFGAPTMFVGDEMHFGQDRLPWIERALAAIPAER
jgi:2-hydroxychromene-2-carboxylate isomerase